MSDEKKTNEQKDAEAAISMQKKLDLIDSASAIIQKIIAAKIGMDEAKKMRCTCSVYCIQNSGCLCKRGREVTRTEDIFWCVIENLVNSQ